MSLQQDGLKSKDPSSTRSGQFDWSDWFSDAIAAIATPTVTASGPDSALVISGMQLSGTRKVNYQLAGGTLGARYTITCRIVTNETPAQTDERSFVVLIEQL